MKFLRFIISSLKVEQIDQMLPIDSISSYSKIIRKPTS